MKRMLALILTLVFALSAASFSAAEGVNGTVVMGIVSSWDNLVPFTNNSYYSSFVISLLYDRLVYVSPDGAVSPRAATAWDLSEDGKTLTFTLNADAKFHDGTPVTAADWVYSIQLLSKNGAGTLFSDQSLLAALEGTDAAGIELSENSVGAQVGADDLQLVLTFKQPVNLDSFLKSQSYYLVVLPSHLLKDLDVADVATWDFWNAPVGSGPAVFSALSADGTELTLKRFADYYQGEANWDTLIVRQTATSALSSALLTGEVDAVYTPVGNDEAIAMQSLPGAENLTFSLTENLVYVYTIAVNNTIVADERIRQAVSYAIDREIIAAFLTGDYVSPIGEPMQLYLTADNPSYPEGLTPKYDPQKAKELLDAAKADGYDGKFVLAAPVAGQRADMALVIGQLLENVGFEVELVTIDAATMMADLRAAADGTYDGGIIVYGISADPLVRNDIYTTASLTVLALTDTTYEDYQAKIAEASGDERAQLIDEYLRYISDQEAAIWLAAKRQCYVFNSRLGEITDSLLGIPNRNIDVWNWVLSR